MVKKGSERAASICFILTVCSGLLFMFEIMLPKTMAYRKDGTSKYNEYLVEDQQTTKQNYLVQRDMENDLLGETFDIVYPNIPPQYERKSDQLPALIVDYANMIRNDIILLDNSVETRTRKRGNIKVEKYNTTRFSLGSNYYPDVMEYANCNNNLCTYPYKCQKILYNQTMLIRKTSPNDVRPWTLPDELMLYLVEYTIMKRDSFGLEAFFVHLPESLNRRWKAISIPVVVSCMCKKDYTIKDK